MPAKVNVREACADTLLLMERSGRLSHMAISEALMRLQFAPKQDRAFFTLLCEGTTERRIYLDYVLDSFSKTKMKKCKPMIRTLLRLGAYQILFTGVRDAAAVNETVAIARKKGFGNLSGFVNGVLRSLVRNKENLPLPDRDREPERWLSIRYSMPEWIVLRLAGEYGFDRAEKMLASFLEARPVTIRVNTEKVSPKHLMQELSGEGIKAEPAGWFPYALHIEGYNYLGRIPSFMRGEFAVQDLSSMLPAAIADLSEGDTVMDVCAAPGGKTFHAADIVGPRGKVISRDLTENKTDLIRENNERIRYEQIEIEEWDACVPDESRYESADVVIADLPCSGLGIMGRKNDIKYHISEAQIKELALLQQKILSVVWRYVKPGGQLIYSTCTMAREENEDNVRWILENTPLKAVSFEEKLPKELRGRTAGDGHLQILPGIDAGDGFFVAKFTGIK